MRRLFIMRAKCYIDFDGTIVSNKVRLYKFFIDSIPDKYNNLIGIDDFWTLKKYSIHEIEWLNSKLNAGIDIEKYNGAKKELIETDQYLFLNELFPYAKSSLTILRKSYDLVLVSRRSYPEQLLKEIKKYQITALFQNIIVLPHGKQKKAEAIKEVLAVGKDDIFIGDTEDDVESGCLLNIKTYFVLSGIRGKWILDKFGENNNIHCIESIEVL